MVEHFEHVSCSFMFITYKSTGTFSDLENKIVFLHGSSPSNCKMSYFYYIECTEINVHKNYFK
jgi:hypothetical protein